VINHSASGRASKRLVNALFWFFSQKRGDNTGSSAIAIKRNTNGIAAAIGSSRPNDCGVIAAVLVPLKIHVALEDPSAIVARTPGLMCGRG